MIRTLICAAIIVLAASMALAQDAAPPQPANPYYGAYNGGNFSTPIYSGTYVSTAIGPFFVGMDPFALGQLVYKGGKEVVRRISGKKKPAEATPPAQHFAAAPEGPAVHYHFHCATAEACAALPIPRPPRTEKAAAAKQAASASAEDRFFTAVALAGRTKSTRAR